MENFNQILEQIEDLNEREIIQAAYNAMIPGKADGIAAFNPSTGEIEELTLQKGNYIPSDKRIYLYTVDQNIYGNASYDICGDILSEEEFEDFKKRNENGENLSAAEYLEKYTNDTFETRFFDFLAWGFDNGESLNWDNIKEQIKECIQYK